MTKTNVFKDLRTAIGLTQDEISNLLKISRVSYCCYELGSRVPRIDIARKIISFAKKHGIEITMNDIYAIKLNKKRKKK